MKNPNRLLRFGFFYTEKLTFVCLEDDIYINSLKKRLFYASVEESGVFSLVVLFLPFHSYSLRSWFIQGYLGLSFT